ncbi:MAG: hypothetical protein ABI416_16450 [Ginsengibacter sp.]
MKKIITLLFSIGAFATSFAQYNHPQSHEEREGQYANSSNGHSDNRWGDNNRDHFDRNHNNSARSRDFQVARINREFDYKIQAIQNDRHMRHREKKAAIRYAQNERSRQLQMVNQRFQHGNNW